MQKESQSFIELGAYLRNKKLALRGAVEIQSRRRRYRSGPRVKRATPQSLRRKAMLKKRNWLANFVLVSLLIAAGLGPRILGRNAAAQNSSGVKYPTFEVDTNWPKLPNNWVIGNVSKIVVDKHDNVWLIHRPRTVPADKIAAPPVVELDTNGKFVQAWGGDGEGFDWPDAEHNVFVDYKDNVWISGSSPSGQSKTQDSDDMILKFTSSGKFLMQIG